MTDEYDVVVVGAGISGAIIAKQLATPDRKVLLLEAGTDLARSFHGYNEQLETFYGALAKTPESPYPFNPDAPQPDIAGIGNAGSKYFVERGRQDFRSTYARTAGGTTLHWMGTCLRMLPEDFKMRERFGRGHDWPIGYDDLEGDYRRAESEIGVSADVADQQYLGVRFEPGYEFPMERIPPSWSDQVLGDKVDDMTVHMGGFEKRIRVRSTPAGRNSTPRGDYRPRGAVDMAADWGPPVEGQNLARDLGERCQGNSACVPICPVQAKYNALKTLSDATAHGRVEVLAQAVASKVLVDASGRVTGIRYLRYEKPGSPRHEVGTAVGRTYVLACHALENAKLMLLSGLHGPRDMIGANLYDHPTLLAWGLAPERVGPYRGPLSTSGIEDLRGGGFRDRHAAFRIEVGNDGWLWPTGAPDSTVSAAVGKGLFGHALRATMYDLVGRQVRIGCLVEQLGDPNNRVTIDAEHTDQLDIPRPVVTYDLDDYVLDGMQAASSVAAQVFAQAQIADHTDPLSSFAAVATHHGKLYAWDGAGHCAGTHLMGKDTTTSVVDSHQRSWEHPNLFLAGPGSMPTMGTSNPTLTVAALAFRTAGEIARDPDGRR
jgi:choline dehydrogenase-like flavoprotein